MLHAPMACWSLQSILSRITGQRKQQRMQFGPDKRGMIEDDMRRFAAMGDWQAIRADLRNKDQDKRRGRQ